MKAEVKAKVKAVPSYFQLFPPVRLDSSDAFLVVNR